MNFTHIRNKVKMLLTEDAYFTICRSHVLYNIYSFTHLQDVFFFTVFTICTRSGYFCAVFVLSSG